jgi:hypothetical protein
MAGIPTFAWQMALIKREGSVHIKNGKHVLIPEIVLP